jgi:hypothetical protein
MFSLRVPKLIEMYILHLTCDIHTGLMRYSTLCKENGIPSFSKSLRLSDDEKSTPDGAVTELLDLKQFKVMKSEKEEKCIDVSQIAFRINSLVYAAHSSQEIFKSIKLRCEKLGIGRFSWQNVALRTKMALLASANEMGELLAQTLIYKDYRSIFVQAVYLPIARKCSLSMTLNALDQQDYLKRILCPEMHEFVCGAYAHEIVVVYHKQLFEPGNLRTFVESDFLEVIESDLETLQSFLEVYTSPDHPSIRLFNHIHNLAAALMPLPSADLIEAYESSLMLEEASKVGPELHNPLCTVHLRNVLCHRIDAASKSFLKKHRIKISKK